MTNRAIILSAVAGSFGALSTIMSKVLASSGALFEGTSGSILMARAALLAGIILTNICGWYCFTLLVSSRIPTPIASGLNMGFNFVITALAGRMLFQEELSIKWFLGAAAILTGTLLIGIDGKVTAEADTEKEK